MCGKVVLWVPGVDHAGRLFSCMRRPFASVAAILAVVASCTSCQAVAIESGFGPCVLPARPWQLKGRGGERVFIPHRTARGYQVWGARADSRLFAM